MLILLALSPVLILLLGAFVLTLLGRYRRPKVVLYAISLLVAGILTLVNSRQPDPAPMLSSFPLQILDLDLRFNFSSPALLFFGLILLGQYTRILLENGRPRLSPASLIALAGLLVLLLADNWPTVLSGWLLFELGLLSWSLNSAASAESRSASWSVFALSLFGLTVGFVAALLMMGGGSSLRLQDSVATGWAAAGLLIACFVRAGLYPFSLPSQESAPAQAGIDLGGMRLSKVRPARPSASRGLHPSVFAPIRPVDRSIDDILRVALNLMAGCYLLVRALIVVQGEIDLAWALQAVGILGVAVTALQLFVETRPEQRMMWAVLAVASPLWLIPFVPVAEAHPAITMWSGLAAWNFALIVLATRVLPLSLPREPWIKILWAAAILCAAGFPLTPGFPGRVALYAAILRGSSPLYLILFAVAMTAVLVALFTILFESRGEQARRPNVLEYGGLAFLLLLPVIEGVIPFLIMSVFGRTVEDASAFAYDALLHAPNLLDPAIVVLTLLLPLPLAFWIARKRAVWVGRVTALAPATRRALDVTTIGRLGVRAMDTWAVALRQISALLDQHPVGWILFAALWLALWLLNVRL